jgi:hypothetical protein
LKTAHLKVGVSTLFTDNEKKITEEVSALQFRPSVL